MVSFHHVLLVTRILQFPACSMCKYMCKSTSFDTFTSFLGLNLGLPPFLPHFLVPQIFFFSLRLCLAQLPGWDRNIVVKSVELEKPRRIHNHSAAENDPLPFHSYHLVLVGVSTRIAHHSYAILISFEAGSSQFCHWAHDNIFSSFAYVPMDILFPTGWKE